MSEQAGGEWLPGLADPIEIGRGGFGVVYKATETDLNRTVAVKILSGNLDDLALQRFDRERRAMGALSGHPNIVPIYRSGLTGDGRPYLVMEYLPGGSLAERLQTSGALPWKDAASIGIRLCAALETAHRAGVLHRDVKPENVFVSGLGAPKLGDFGIARLEGAPQTQSAMITASLAHAAPELIDGKPPSVQSDVYGLASTIVTFITGAPPFSRPTDDSIVPLLARIATEPLPDLRPRGVPDRLSTVFEKAMAKDPGARYESCALFGRAIQEAQAGVGETVTPLEVQGIDPTVTPGVGAPRAADPTVSVPTAATPPPVTPAPSVSVPPAGAPPSPAVPVSPVSPAPAASSPTSPPVTTGAPFPGVAAAQPAQAVAPGAYPAATAGPPSGPLPGYTTGTASVSSGGASRTVIVLAVVAVLVVVGLIGLVLMGGGDDEQADRRPRATLLDRITDPTEPDDPVGSTTSGAPPTEAGGPTTLEPGTVAENGLIVTEIPFGLGDNDRLDALASQCAAGDLTSCDQLYKDSPVGSLYEEFGGTCGDRVEFDPQTPCPENPAFGG
jgi:serine/threonine protein kinase